MSTTSPAHASAVVVFAVFGGCVLVGRSGGDSCGAYGCYAVVADIIMRRAMSLFQHAPFLAIMLL